MPGGCFCGPSKTFLVGTRKGRCLEGVSEVNGPIHTQPEAIVVQNLWVLLPYSLSANTHSGFDNDIFFIGDLSANVPVKPTII